MPPKRTATASEGIAMLKQGSTVKKYGRAGKPHNTLFRLSEDESMLGWEGRGLKLKRRAVRICDLVELRVGQESAVFQRIASSTELGAAHMSMTLLLKAHPTPSYPRPSPPRPARHRLLAPHLPASLHLTSDGEQQPLPSPRTTPAAPRPRADTRPLAAWQAGSSADDRETLDLSCDDEADFGLWVAALRTLLAEHQPLPAASRAVVDHLPAAALRAGGQARSASPEGVASLATEQAETEKLEARVRELQRQLDLQQKAGAAGFKGPPLRP